MIEMWVKCVQLLEMRWIILTSGCMWMVYDGFVYFHCHEYVSLPNNINNDTACKCMVSSSMVTVG
jgi:hypothetical protein